MRKILWWGVSVVALGQPAWGQDELSLADTITVNGLPTNISRTGVAASVIDRTEIESIQGADITRVLQRVPGVTLSRNGSAGSFTGVSLRGAASEQLLVLIDGVAVADPASPSGGFDMGNMLTGNIGKIDVTRSSNSTIWGSGAMSGVMNISTRRDEGASASAEYGSRGTATLTANGVVASERNLIGLAAGYFRTDGFSSAANGTEADGFEQLAFGGHASTDITDTLTAFARGEWSKGKLDMDGYPAPDYMLADTKERQETERYSGSGGFDYNSGDTELHGVYSVSRTARDNFNPDWGSAPTFSSIGQNQQLSLRGKQGLFDAASLAYGASYDWSDYRTSYDAAAKTHSTGGYAQLGYEGTVLNAHAGARVEDHQRFGAHTTFGADASYEFSDNWRLRASYGEGFKAPTLYQLYSDYGDQALKPEESTSFDVGIERGGRKWDSLFIALTVYRRSSQNLIAWGYPAGKPYGGYVNIGRARAQGIEAEIAYPIAPALKLSAQYSYLDAKDRISGNALARRPKHSATLFADWEVRDGVKLGADLRVVSGSWDDAYQSVRLGAYEVADFRVSYAISTQIEAFARVENAFDSHYQTAAGYYSAPRGVFVGIRLKP